MELGTGFAALPRGFLAGSVLLCAALVAGKAAGETADGGWPALSYFTGSYEMLGRDAAEPPRLISRLVRMVPKGAALEVQICAGPPGRLARPEDAELGNELDGEIAGIRLECSYYNNFDNYPQLVCYGAGGERVSLWPLATPSGAPLLCK